MNDQAGKDAHSETGKQNRERRPYKSPTLVEYGSIARLTHSGGSTVREGAVGQMNHGCL